MVAPSDNRDRLLVAATVVAAVAFGLYVAAFWPTIVGEASNACEERAFDRTAWPPSGNCGDVSAREFSWPWVEAAILALSGVGVVLAVVAVASRPPRR